MANRFISCFLCIMAWLGQSNLGLCAAKPRLNLGTKTLVPTYLVAARAPVLSATLQDAGWQELPLVCTAELPFAVSLVAEPSPDSWYMHPQAGLVFIWSHNNSYMHGLPVWVLLAYHPERENPNSVFLGCKASETSLYQQELTQHLLAGIAMLHETKTASEWGPLPLIELRESPSAIDSLIALQDKDRALFPAHNSSDILLPPMKPLPLPLSRDVVWRDNQNTNKLVALTFDACSTFSHGDYNHEVIDILVQYHVPATLFVGGHWAQLHASTLREIANLHQFEFGNHTYSHPHMTHLSKDAQRQELLWTQYLIYAITGFLPQYFRPPYGEVNDDLVQEAAALGLFTIEFDLPAGDADMHVNAALLTHWVVSKVQPGSIVVMHMNRPGNKTAVALPQVIEALRAKGFTLTTVGHLLDHTNQKVVSP